MHCSTVLSLDCRSTKCREYSDFASSNRSFTNVQQIPFRTHGIPDKSHVYNKFENSLASMVLNHVKSQRVAPSVKNRRAANMASNFNRSTGHSPGQLPLYSSPVGQFHASGSWSEDPRASSSNLSRDGSLLQRVTPTISAPSSRTPSIRVHDGGGHEWRQPSDLPVEEHWQDKNKKRTANRDFQRPYVKEMAAAHAENRDPLIQIPVCQSSTVFGLKSPSHRAARLCARQTLNFKVRSYKGKSEYWMSQVQNIAEKLEQQFTYSRPLDINYLAKFLKNTLKNDRKCWKKYFFEHPGLRHPRCSEEAFTEWRKYWLSAEEKDESIQMTEMRKGKKKSQRREETSGEHACYPESQYQVGTLSNSPDSLLASRIWYSDFR